MCGIAGALTREPQLGDTLSPALAALQHRGPDGTHRLFASERGVIADPQTHYWRACLGHTRLALVGSADMGQQPSSTVGGRVLSTINGEIYNHDELRAELAGQGIFGTGDSDCHVAPNLYQRYGLAGLAKMQGVYAGAILDVDTMTIIIFKDRFGSRPIYYTVNSRGIFFASEVKALLALSGAQAELNRQAAIEYFTFQTPLRRHTMFAGIDTLRPAEALVYANGRIELHDIAYERRSYTFASFKEAVSYTRDALDAAINSQWRADSGAYLSSGIDTNAIVATQALSGLVPDTYTAAFPSVHLDEHDVGANESVRAAEMANHYGVKHRQIALLPTEFAQALPAMIWHLEDLRMPMSYGAWQISQEASNNAPVLFSGMGGDELFAGYVDRLVALAPSDTSDARWLTSYYDMWCARMITDEERIRSLGCLGTNADLRDGAYEALADQFEWARSRYRLGPVRRLLALEQSFYLPGLLIVDDRMSMAHSVETRIPLIDYRLADIAESVPEDFLVRGNLGKLLIRHAVMDRVPRSIACQPKQPFRVPESTWYRNELAEWVEVTLFGKSSVIGGFISPRFIRDVLSAHRSGVQNRRRLIWSLLSFEYWCRLFLAGAAVAEDVVELCGS